MTTGRLEYWVRQKLLSPVVRASAPVLHVLAFVWRRLLFRTTFIAVTGSLGKTTAKECLATILASCGPAFRSYRNQNIAGAIAINLLRVRPWHRFAVLEVGATAAGAMSRPARLLRPDVAILLNVLRTHTTSFQSLEEHAAEKRKLLDALTPGGLAVLNADDPLLRPMADRISNRVVLFGTAEDCDYRAERVSARWPQRLAFSVRHGPTVQAVETQLVGAHWLPSVLAALATAHALGVGLQPAAEALRGAEPFPGRMQPVRVPNGAIVLRDDYNASIDTIEASLRVLEEASAPRRLLVITDMSDLGKNRKQRLKYLARRSPRAADVLVLMGEIAEYGRSRAIEAGMEPACAHAFPSIRDAAEFLRLELKPGDLMLLKGRTTDHAARIFLAQLGPVGCWKDNCAKRMLCDICWELEITPDQLRKATPVPAPASSRDISLQALGSPAPRIPLR